MPQAPDFLDEHGNPVDAPQFLDAQGNPITPRQGTSMLNVAADALPAAGSLVGSFAGAPAGPIGRMAGAAIGASAGHGFRSIARNASQLPGAIADVTRNLVNQPAATLQGFQQGAAEGANAMGKQAAIYGGTEGAGEALAAGAKMLPNTTRAGQKFQQVMGVAKDQPVDISKPGDVALRIHELADRGSTMPRVVSKFLRRITDPNQAPLTYGEARDFASNISRLSADEYNRLTPVIQREVGNLRVALNDAVAKAAAAAGKGEDYLSAMKEYAQAAKLRDIKDEIVQGARRAAPYAAGASGVGYWLAQKLRSALPD